MALDKFNNFQEFWPIYVHEHRVRANRTLHVIGSTLVLICICMSVLSNNFYFLFAMPVFGYGFAWGGHFFIEKNKPATFVAPIYSLIGDWKMFYLILSGKMDDEMRRLGLDPDYTR